MSLCRIGRWIEVQNVWSSSRRTRITWKRRTSSKALSARTIDGSEPGQAEHIACSTQAYRSPKCHKMATKHPVEHAQHSGAQKYKIPRFEKSDSEYMIARSRDDKGGKKFWWILWVLRLHYL